MRGLAKRATEIGQTTAEVADLVVELFDLGFEHGHFIRLVRVGASQLLMLLMPLSNLLLQLLLVSVFALAICPLR